MVDVWNATGGASPQTEQSGLGGRLTSVPAQRWQEAGHNQLSTSGPSGTPMGAAYQCWAVGPDQIE